MKFSVLEKLSAAKVTQESDNTFKLVVDRSALTNDNAGVFTLKVEFKDDQTTDWKSKTIEITIKASATEDKEGEASSAESGSDGESAEA